MWRFSPSVGPSRETVDRVRVRTVGSWFDQARSDTRRQPVSRKFFSLLLLGVMSVGVAGFTPVLGNHGVPCDGCGPAPCGTCDGCPPCPPPPCCESDYDDDCDD